MSQPASRGQISGSGEKLPPRDEHDELEAPYLPADAVPECAWCLNCPTVQAKYGGLVAAIRGQEVLGAGMGRAEAWEARKRVGCFSQDEVTFVLIPSVLDDALLS